MNDHIQAELRKHEALLERIWEFTQNRTDDVSVGIGRIIKPLEVCAECDGENDYSQLKYCRCWSPVSESDLERLSDLGLEIRDPEEEGEH